MAGRIIASIVFLPCFILITRSGGVYFMGLIALVVLTACAEFFTLVRGRGARPWAKTGTIAALGMLAMAFWGQEHHAMLLIGALTAALLVAQLTRRDGHGALLDVASTLLGVVYVGWLGSHFVLLRELPVTTGQPYATGAQAVFLAVSITWAGDTGAYFVGSSLGRTPLLPRVSGKKTWEGAVGGLAAGVVAAFIARATFAPFLPGAILTGAIGAAVPAVGTLGDLAESLIKRDAHVKDTAPTIPGHGGVLDRFDSLLFTAPILYYFLKLFIF